MATNAASTDNSTATPRTVVAGVVADHTSPDPLWNFQDWMALCECSEATIHRVSP